MLAELAVVQGFKLMMREVDIERKVQDDLTKSTLWNSILGEINEGRYQAIMLSPPCGTWSRVRLQWKTSPGPRPVRNVNHPWGFPWLSNQQMEHVRQANLFVAQSLEAATRISSLGGYFIIEHPEDLGRVHGKYLAASPDSAVADRYQCIHFCHVSVCHGRGFSKANTISDEYSGS